MEDNEVLLSSQMPSSPHLSRLVWLAEQLQHNAEELAVLFGGDAILVELSAEEFHELRRVAAEARAAAGDILLLAAAAHRRAAAGTL